MVSDSCTAFGDSAVVFKATPDFKICFGTFSVFADDSLFAFDVAAQVERHAKLKTTATERNLASEELYI